MSYTIEEFLDIINTTLTYACALPNQLPPEAIRTYIETIALPYFWKIYMEGTSKMYYFVSKEAFKTEEFTQYSYITLPCEVQSVTYIYQVMSNSLYELGLDTPNMSVNMGVTSQPYLSSYVTTIGEIGVYKTILDSFSDMLNQLNKYTVRYDYNQPTKRLNILTEMKYDLILEVDANVPAENMYADPYFQRYIIGWSKQALGNLLGRMDFTLPGGIKYNTSDLVTQGTDEMNKVIEEINNMSQVAWFRMVKR